MYHVRYKEGGGLYTGIFFTFFVPTEFARGFCLSFVWNPALLLMAEWKELL